MKNLLGPVVLGIVISSNAAHAGQRTVTLVVDNMVCEACPYMVKKTIERLSGVSMSSFHTRTRRRW